MPNKDLQLAYYQKLKEFGYDYATVSHSPEVKSQDLPEALKDLRAQVLKCHLCHLAKTRIKVVFGEGNELADVMFIGEGPGKDEDESGRPFVGAAGQLLTKMIEDEKSLGLPRGSIYIANVVKCRPPNNRVPEDDEVNSCLPFLFRQIETIKPKIIVTLGGVAISALLKQSVAITKIRGVWRKFGEIDLLPTYHPSYLLRNPSAKKDAWTDMLAIRAKLLSAN
ncbi:MAG: hypothetical protein RL154_1021 [Pseudomonadota bacterium]